MNVAIIGASDKPDRYSYQAFLLLRENGHAVYPVHPQLKMIDGLRVFASLREVIHEIHTVTIYVNAQNSDAMEEDFWVVYPHRIIFNPGAENLRLADEARARGIDVINACTLVMLRTGQFMLRM